MRSKLFHAIVLAGSSLGAAACSRQATLPTGDASTNVDMSAPADLASSDLACNPIHGLCIITDGGMYINCCVPDFDACFPCYI
jgi:hypothetical protein